MKIKVLELFGGISAPHKALTNLGLEVETIDYVEFDPKVVEIRNEMYGTNFKPQSVVDYHCDKEVDLLIGGSPCQDFSNAGSNKGGDVESGTRSSLMWEQLRIIEETKPKITIWENVKSVLGKRHKHNFEGYQMRLDEMGYKNYYKVLNAVDFGIPQKRERVFLVSIRKDINVDFNFENLITKELEPLTSFVDFNDLSKGDACIPQATKSGYIKGITPLVFDGSFPESKTRRGRVQTFNGENVVPTITCAPKLIKLTLGEAKESNLSPRECWRLMGFDDIDFDKAQKVSGKTALYHVAGNSIVVDVLEAIFKELFKEML